MVCVGLWGIFSVSEWKCDGTVCVWGDSGDRGPFLMPMFQQIHCFLGTLLSRNLASQLLVGFQGAAPCAEPDSEGTAGFEIVQVEGELRLSVL